MLLRSPSPPALNSLVEVQPEPEMKSLRFVKFTQLYADHNVQRPRFVRTLSEADLRNPLSQACPRRLGLRRGFGSVKISRNLSTEIFLNNGLLDEAWGKQFNDSGAQISIGCQSGDPHEEPGEKNMAAIGTQGHEGPLVSRWRNEDLMGANISEGTRVASVCDGAVVGSKKDINFVSGGFGDEDGGGFSRGGGYGGGDGRFGSDPNKRDAYYKKMMQADPGNPLLLANYGRFLQEVSIEY